MDKETYMKYLLKKLTDFEEQQIRNGEMPVPEYNNRQIREADADADADGLIVKEMVIRLLILILSCKDFNVSFTYFVFRFEGGCGY